MASSGNVEDSAAKLLTRAVELDQRGRYTESLICYQEGVQMLLDVLKYKTDENTRNHFRQKVAEYIDRAEKVKLNIEKQKDAGSFHEQVKICADEMGHTYDSLFGRLFTDDVIEITIEDAYIRTNSQLRNFLRFCEMSVRRCSNLHKLCLITTRTDGSANEQQQTHALQEIRESLRERRVELVVQYNDSLHDRVIRLSSGWIIKIGRGLDIYKPVKSNFSFGFTDFSLRPCKETTVDIYHADTSKTRTTNQV